MKPFPEFNTANTSLGERVLKQALFAVTFISFYCFVLYGLVFCPNMEAFVNALISSLFFVLLLFIARDERKHAIVNISFTLYSLVALSLNWIFTNGFYGGTSYFYMLLIGFYAVVSPSRYYNYSILLVFLNIILLATIEIYYPQFIYFDLSPSHAFICSISNLILSLIISTLGLVLVRTEYNKERRNVQEKKKRLIAANNARSRFLANISHEIRTPLNGVMGMASLLENSNPTNEQKEYVQTIKISSNRLLKIINEILDYSKAEAGKTELRIEPFSLRKCVEDAMNINISKALEKELFLSYHIDENAPDFLLGDGGKVQQILINLLGNAIKFTNKGSIYLHVQRVNKTAKHIQLQFSVKDTGIGIPRASIPKLFEAFTQVDDSRTRTNSGTGLGLAICKRFTQLMDGHIWVNSTEQEGSTFYFTAKFETLPNQFKIPLQTNEGAIIQQVAEQSRLTILLVEDDKINQILAIRLLEKMGYTPHAVNNGQEAIDALKKKAYNIVLMDVQMPVLDGLEATKIIRKELNNQPIIVAMTANAMIEDQQLCEEAGMDDFLAKPINIKALEATLLKWKQTTS